MILMRVSKAYTIHHFEWFYRPGMKLPMIVEIVSPLCLDLLIYVTSLTMYEIDPPEHSNVPIIILYNIGWPWGGTQGNIVLEVATLEDLDMSPISVTSHYDIVSWEPERALLQLKDVPLRSRRALSLYKVYVNSDLLVLNGTSLICNSALLALNWRYRSPCPPPPHKKRTSNVIIFKIFKGK